MINQVLTKADATTIQFVAFVMNEQAFQAFSGLSSENVLFFPLESTLLLRPTRKLCVGLAPIFDMINSHFQQGQG